MVIWGRGGGSMGHAEKDVVLLQETHSDIKDHLQVSEPLFACAHLCSTCASRPPGWHLCELLSMSRLTDHKRDYTAFRMHHFLLLKVWTVLQPQVAPLESLPTSGTCTCFPGHSFISHTKALPGGSSPLFFLIGLSTDNSLCHELAHSLLWEHPAPRS
ncbi:hypothetical protein DPEC_G00362850 [Dallia pectoralis]|nr:hypothetical protein DPEC_G00362850 [Dallia pectoralis]